MLNAFALVSKLVKSFTKSHVTHSKGCVNVSITCPPVLSCVSISVALPPVDKLLGVIFVMLPVSVYFWF